MKSLTVRGIQSHGWEKPCISSFQCEDVQTVLIYYAEIFCIHHEEESVSFNFSEMSQLALSTSFEYLFYGSTTSINILFLLVR